MEMQDLYRKFNQLLNARSGSFPHITNLDRVPPNAVITSWCEDFPAFEAHEQSYPGEDLKICQRLSVTAMCIRIARQDGMSAALLWKLQNG